MRNPRSVIDTGNGGELDGRIEKRMQESLASVDADRTYLAWKQEGPFVASDPFLGRPMRVACNDLE